MEMKPRPRRTALEREARKRDILEAAARLFSERGFHAVTVDEVADEVGLAKGTLYLYFASKDDLFHTLVVQKTQCLLDRLRESVAQARPFSECLVDVVGTHSSFLQENLAYFGIVHAEMTRMHLESHLRLHRYAAEAFQAYLTILAELVGKGQDEGVLREGDPSPLVTSLSGLLNAFIFHSVLGAKVVPPADHVDEIVDLYLHGAGAKAREGSRSSGAGHLGRSHSGPVTAKEPSGSEESRMAKGTQDDDCSARTPGA